MFKKKKKKRRKMALSFDWKVLKSTEQSCLHLDPGKKSCFILFDKLNQGEKMCYFSPVCTSPKLPPHSGSILDQIDLTRSQKPGNGLASQGFHCR